MRRTSRIGYALPGYLTQKARDYSRVIKSIIEPLEPGICQYRIKNFWRFLKVIHILPLDFTTSTALPRDLDQAGTSSGVNQMKTPMPTAESTWLELLKTAEESAAGAKTLAIHRLAGGNAQQDIRPLNRPRASCRICSTVRRLPKRRFVPLLPTRSHFLGVVR